MYTVKTSNATIRFTSFEEVIQWVWNTHKILLDHDGFIDKHEACEEISKLLIKENL